jgi:DNA-binding IclR family transcriptional regulator
MAVRHAIDVLRCLSASTEPLGVNELARQVGLHKSSVSRILVTLEDAHLVERSRATNKFTPGIGLVSLAAPLISNLRLLDIARPILEDLAEQSGETVSLNIWDGDAAVSILQVPGANAIKHFAPPGMRNPAHCTAAGKVLLAFAGEEDRDRILSGDLASYTDTTTVDRGKLRDELERVRRQGWAVNEGELEADVGAVAGIVHGLDGQVVAALVATVPMYRFGEERQSQLISYITEIAATLSRRLGHVR